MYVMEWDSAFSSGPSEAGGKGWNLSRLVRYGFPVPPGGVISAEAYRKFCRHPDLAERLQACAGITAERVTAAGCEERLAAVREAMVQTPIPSEVVAELHALLSAPALSGRAMAVRSSATAEDSAHASFAGIHRSFLGVQGLPAVVDAVRACYASLWTPQAVAYRRKQGLPDEAVAAAVVILAMVPARAAGVGFSCDPRTGRLDRCAIAASLGLGESVVSGSVEADEYLVDVTEYPPVAVERRLGRKGQQVVLQAEGGTRAIPTSTADAARPALTEPQIAELCYLLGRVHDSLGQMERPQDVEWAHDGEQFWLLQARPLTVLPRPVFPAIADQPVIWSNANLKDILPGVQSALGWSFIRHGIDILMAGPLRAVGYAGASGMTWTRLVDGRAYFNLSALQWAFYDAMGTDPAEFNRIIGGHQPKIRIPPSTVADKLGRSLRQLRLMRSSLQAMRQAPDDFRQLWSWTERVQQMDFRALPKERFVAQWLELKAKMADFLPRFNLINGVAGWSHQETARLLQRPFGEAAVGLVNAMMAGSAGVTSAEQGERLVQLGNTALEEPAVRSFFENPACNLSQWRECLAGTSWIESFEGYLRDFGHRGVYELEPLNPRWHEDPAYLLETIRSQVLAGTRIRLEGQAEKREQARRTVFGRLGPRPLAVRVRYMVGLAAKAGGLREMAKSVLVKASGLSRYLGLEIGSRMTAVGLLAEPADIFHLSWLDIEAYLMDRPGLQGLRTLVADRKARRQELLALTPPNVIIEGESPPPTAAVPPPTGSVLSGMGVATGKATGPARVIRHPHEGNRLQPGDVLVAPSTDPAWTPLFLRAAAVITEVGGFLSHGAIVAREYGLPAVVNVPDLLSIVQEGELLTVDGDTGKVYRQG